jgi:hypothetical protein
MHRWPPSFPICGPHRSLVPLPLVVSLGLSEFFGNQTCFCQPAFEVDDNLAGGLLRVRPTDTTLDLSPMVVEVPLIPSMQREVCAEVIARIVGTPDLFVTIWKHAREPADRTMLAEVALEMLAAGKCCVARVPIVIQCVTDVWLLFYAVVNTFAL